MYFSCPRNTDTYSSVFRSNTRAVASSLAVMMALSSGVMHTELMPASCSFTSLMNHRRSFLVSFTPPCTFSEEPSRDGLEPIPLRLMTSRDHQPGHVLTV